MCLIREATTPEDIEATGGLFQEYAAELGIDLGFQDFLEELASLPGEYSPPRGRILLVASGDRSIGCVALRPIGEHVCEMKRMYIQPSHRRKGLGWKMAVAVVAAASEMGYSKMRLDTLARMEGALGLYRALGFREIGPYYHNPHHDAVFMELDLR